MVSETFYQRYIMVGTIISIGTIILTLQPDNPCASDPVVQATVAKLQLSILLTGGILGVLTAAWLSSVRF